VKQENKMLVYSGGHYCGGQRIKLPAISLPFGEQFRMASIFTYVQRTFKRDRGNPIVDRWLDRTKSTA